MNLEERAKNDMKSLHFTLSDSQHKILKKLKEENFIKIIYIIRLGAAIVSKKPGIIKKSNDADYCHKEAKHYKIDLKNEVYDEICQLSKTKKISKGKILRIGINEIIKFCKEDTNE